MDSERVPEPPTARVQGRAGKVIPAPFPAALVATALAAADHTGAPLRLSSMSPPGGKRFSSLETITKRGEHADAGDKGEIAVDLLYLSK
jgi:hypothetical protein